MVDPPGATPSPSPYSKLEAITDPARAGVDVSPVEWICRSFAIAIDSLSASLSLVLGPWSQRDLFLQITPAKLVLGLVSALIIRLLFQVARFFLRKHSKKPRTDTSERYWIDGVLPALRKGINLFSWVTAGLLFVSPLLPHLALASNSQAPFQITSRLAEIGYFLSLIVFVYWIVRSIDRWLNQLARHQPRRWYQPTFPLVGQLIYYDFLLTAFHYLINLLDLPGGAAAIASKIVGIVSILVNTVMVIQMVRALEDIAQVRTEMRNYDTYRYRSLQTRLRVLRQLIIFVLVIICAATILMNFDPVRQIGTGLLASAGVAGVIVGLAAQKSLSTIIAGLQIALTNPMKIDDVVVVDGEYGQIEEISLTYVVVRAWDQRRIILPVTYFLDKSFQNWTRSSSELLGTVFLYVDYLVSIDQIRATAKQVVSDSSLWDKRAFGVQVTDWKTDSVEVRILVSAGTSGKLFDLRCEVREKLLTYLQQREPNAFPVVRNVGARGGQKADGNQAELSDRS
ncbi:MAG TPA: mechanosensitive ion channel domain-containing protein [Chthoniobacterales bacterium]|nr:mechanosensitive ion channel domain-containing protein [Chthoniobacterales bacterium]